jgi:aminopeptidase YwaD
MTDLRTAVLQHLHYLAGEIGPRPIGSASNRAAGAYIASVLTSSGYTVEKQEYACPDWVLQGVSLEQGGSPVDVRANGYSPSCDVIAPAVVAATPAELDGLNCAGRICIIHGNLTRREELDPPYAIYLSEPDPVASALLNKKPLAIVTVSPMRCDPVPVICDWEFVIPSVTVDCDTGRLLLRHSDAPLHLAIASTRSPSTAANIVGTLRGRSESRRLVLCAHFDTRFGSPGALDNASGTAVLLGLAQSLQGVTPACNLEFVFFSGEEAAGIDVTAYFQHVKLVDDIVAVINVDAVGSWVGATGVVTMGGSPALEANVLKTMAAFPGVAAIDPWVESDHSGFTWRGVPSIPLTTSGYPHILHGARDIEDLIDPNRLDQAARFVAELIDSLQRRTPSWARPTA